MQNINVQQMVDRAAVYMGSDVVRFRKNCTPIVLQWVEQYALKGFDALTLPGVIASGSRAGQTDIPNQKGLFRFVELVNNCLATETGADQLCKSEGARASYALALTMGASKQNRVNFDQLQMLLSGIGSDNTQHVNGVSGATIRAVVGSVKKNSVDSMVSRTVGINGFFSVLGIAHSAGKGACEVTKRDHPLIALVFGHLAKQRPDAINRIANAKK